jgi:hypothetical protein
MGDKVRTATCVLQIALTRWIALIRRAIETPSHHNADTPIHRNADTPSHSNADTPSWYVLREGGSS